MKTKIIFENQNENAVQKSKDKNFKKLISKSIFLSLLEEGLINQKQYEECLKKLEIDN